jgi:hypothetical protein
MASAPTVVVMSGIVLVTADHTIEDDTAASTRLVTAVLTTADDRFAGELVAAHKREQAIGAYATAVSRAFRTPPYVRLGGAVVVPGDIEVGVPLTATFYITDAEKTYAVGLEAGPFERMLDRLQKRRSTKPLTSPRATTNGDVRPCRGATSGPAPGLGRPSSRRCRTASLVRAGVDSNRRDAVADLSDEVPGRS